VIWSGPGAPLGLHDDQADSISAIVILGTEDIPCMLDPAVWVRRCYWWLRQKLGLVSVRIAPLIYSRRKFES
jgi:hypothetical protein